MTLFLDSADLADITRMSRLGVIKGITMNPTLLRQQTAEPLKHLEAVVAASSGLVMYQATKVDGQALKEAMEAYECDPLRVVIKVPAVSHELPLAAKLIRLGVPVALTAAMQPGHMLLCEALGARYIIPYVDRAGRDSRGSASIVRDIGRIRRGEVRIVAASIKSPEQAAQARLDGADIVTAPAAVLADLITHPMSEEAAREFDQNYME